MVAGVTALIVAVVVLLGSKDSSMINDSRNGVEQERDGSSC